LSGNQATFTGGGIHCFAPAVVVSSTITNNTAWSGGGIINYAQISDGFGLWPIWGGLEMRNTILAGNHTGYDPALFSGTAPDLFGFLWGSGYNLIGDGSGAVDGGGFAETDLVGGLYIGIVKKKPQYTAPIDPRLGPLADNGGPTPTHALYIGSPASDAGDPSFAPPPDTDQRGEGFPRVIAGRLDIGAFEGAIEPPSKRPGKK
jgi:hypothetical protein